MIDLRSQIAEFAGRDDHRAAWGVLSAAVLEKPTTATCHLVSELADSLDAARAGLVAQRVALLTNYTADPLAPVLRARGLPSGLLIRPYVPAFDTWMQEIADPGSELRRLPVDVVVIDLQADSLCPALCREFLSLDAAAVDAAIAAVEEVMGTAVRSIRGWSAAKIVIQLWPRPDAPTLGILDHTPSGQRAAFDRLNARVRTAASAAGDVFFVDADRLMSDIGSAAWRDARLWAMARIPYTPAAIHRIAEEQLRYLRAFTGRTRKVLVLDLDDTLWGGVLGERGADGLDLGGAYPGSAFVDFQLAIRELQRRGVVLAINSSNNADEALRIVESHPAMALRPDAFAATRINWQDKASNMTELAAELGLGLDSMVFIDNSPAECARMRQALPEVLTLELRGDPAGYAHWLGTVGVFDSLTYSDDDRQRGARYRGEAQRAQRRGAVGSLDDYLASLEMELVIEPIGDATIARAADLTQRTNQFNMTTRRRTRDDIRQWLSAGSREAYVCSLTDRFGAQGIIAYAALDGVGRDEARITDLLVSCRVLKRGVERAILAQLSERARQSGCRALVGEFHPTARNAPFAGFYQSAGLVPRPGANGEEFVRPLDGTAFDAPPYIRTRRTASPTTT